MEVYDRPVNRFVAGFLGTPPMNFFNGKILMKDSKPVFVLSDGTAISLSLLNGKIAGYSGREMVFGIRPEHLKVDPIEGQNENLLRVKVDVVEPLGDRKDAYLTAGNGQKFIANLNPHVKIHVDEQVVIYVDIRKAHLFEMGVTGINVSCFIPDSAY
jgi:multiple sugar transport system ATP-binding protein